MPARFLRSLWRNQDGAAGAMVIGGAAMLTGAAAVAVDFGSFYLAKRELQGVADAAAMAAVSGDIAQGSASAAQALLTRSAGQDTRIVSLVPGTYARAKSVAPDMRFAPGGAEPTAVRIELEKQIPLLFGQLVTGRQGMAIRARATAARIDMAGFSLRSHLLEISGGLPNRILSSIAGVELNLTDSDVEDLVAGTVDLVALVDELRKTAHATDKTLGDVLDTARPVGDIVAAMAKVAPDGSVQAALGSVAGRLGNTSIRLSDIVDLGPIGASDVNDGRARIEVDAFSLLRSTIELARGPSWQANVDLGLPGLAGTSIRLAGNRGEAHSPWLTVTQSRDVIVRTGRMRLYITTNAAAALAPLASLRVPLYAEIAASEARLNAIRCTGADAGVTLDVKPSIGSLAIADIDTGAMTDFSRPMPLGPGTLASVLGITASASGHITLGGASWRQVAFSKSDIAAKRVKTVATNDALTATTASLVSQTTVSIRTILGTTTVSPLANSIGATLGAVAPTLDGVLNQVTGLLGVKLGTANVAVDRLRCGIPTLVA